MKGIICFVAFSIFASAAMVTIAALIEFTSNGYKIKELVNGLFSGF